MEKEKFNVSEVLKSNEYIAIVADEIDFIKQQRKLRPQAPQGKRYVRDWYDRMVEQSLFNSHFFISNIIDIWLKKSNLSSEFRKVINVVCTTAMQKYIDKKI